ncbi:MAG: hypothetical protein QGG36_03165 [Pirellulaceae bacterium]|jgi:hypothetical protein|nr:hypothetical protein [Pirellulaceae bacterium]MDP7014779.1 hypothetical protein [Pirellulaceae bacterium]
MRLRHVTILLIACLPTIADGTDNHWNQFRGPNGNGRAVSQDLPIEFTEAKNVRWKTAIPGVGWSSPVVWKNQVWVTTGRQGGRQLFAICADAQSGELIHNVKVFDVDAATREWNAAARGGARMERGGARPRENGALVAAATPGSPVLKHGPMPPAADGGVNAPGRVRRRPASLVISH